LRILQVSDSTPKPKRETVVNYEFTEDSVPPSSCCCGKIKVGCRIVAICSLLAIIANAVLYFFGIPRLGLSGTIEILLLIVDFITVFFLFLGLSKKRARLLKPYLFFNVRLFDIHQYLIKGGELSNNILFNLHSILRCENLCEMKLLVVVSCLVTAAVMLGLIAVIIVDVFFVHVVYRTFHFFAYQKDKTRRRQGDQTSTTDL
uniref:G_PROTEIN_RECEP_F1_2 domain-containing protein n=1 Tax=Angiostrongylus costaricensis TaxID=334426 RepID=A0A0R3PPK9_ANGCS